MVLQEVAIRHEAQCPRLQEEASIREVPRRHTEDEEGLLLEDVAAMVPADRLCRLTL